MRYFGRWDEPDDALRRYLAQKDDLLAGRTPRTDLDGLTLRDLANRFLTKKNRLAEASEIRRRSFEDYRYICRLILGVIDGERFFEDLRIEDFDKLRAEIALSKTGAKN